MSALSREVFGRMSTLDVWPGNGRALLADIEAQFRRVGAMAEGQREYLQGVIEFYQTRTNTKMMIAAERLAVIAAVTLPVTALSSIVGMNVIVNARTHVGQLAVLLTVMAVMSAAVLVWAAAQGLVVTRRSSAGRKRLLPPGSPREAGRIDDRGLP
jgi:magnesium transporter